MELMTCSPSLVLSLSKDEPSSWFDTLTTSVQLPRDRPYFDQRAGRGVLVRLESDRHALLPTRQVVRDRVLAVELFGG